MVIEDGGESNVAIARTNNICEYYNYLLNKKMNITSPRLSILIDCLLNEELQIREFLMKSVTDFEVDPPLPRGFTVQEDCLPIGSLHKFLQEKKSNYNLRSAAKDEQFQLECINLVKRSYKILFLASLESTDVEEMKIEEKQEEGSVEGSYTEIVSNLLEQEKEEFENLTFQEPNLKPSVTKR